MMKHAQTGFISVKTGVFSGLEVELVVVVSGRERSELLSLVVALVEGGVSFVHALPPVRLEAAPRPGAVAALGCRPAGVLFVILHIANYFLLIRILTLGKVLPRN